MIYKTFFGSYIDLSKLVSISNAYFIDRMGSGGYYVGFHMDFQLMDRSLVKEFKLTTKESPWLKNGNSAYSLLLTDGTIDDNPHPPVDESTIQAVANLQKQIDAIIKVWRGIY